MWSYNPTLATVILALLSSLSTATKTCSKSFSQAANTTGCIKLDALGAEFGWNHYGARSNVIDIVFGAKLESETAWLAWGLNPGDVPKMVGTRALVGIKYPDQRLNNSTYNVTRDIRLGCALKPSTIELEVRRLSFDYVAVTSYFTLRATVVLPPEYNITRLNVVWQIGYGADGMELKMHPAKLPNFDSRATVNLMSGSCQCIGKHRLHLRLVHGILSMIGWGTFLPIGVIFARYFKKFPVHVQWWQTFHITSIAIGYILGAVAWAIGIWFGFASPDYSFRAHRIIGIIIFTFSTAQMMSLWLKRKTSDYMYLQYWNVIHYLVGYGLVIMIIYNNFKGLKILNLDEPYQFAYAVVLIILAAITFGLESWTWIKFSKKQKRKTTTQDSAPKTDA